MNHAPPCRPIRPSATALLFAAVLAAAALAVGLGTDLLADSQAPVTRMLVAECQGFEALATAGGKAASCAADDADAVPATVPVPTAVAPVSDAPVVPVRLRSKV